MRSASSEEAALARIELLKQEYLQKEMRPKQYARLVRLWGYVLGLGGVTTYLLFGEHGLFTLCDTAPFCAEFAGHFGDYIAFRYAMYGVLIGFLLRYSFDEARAGFGTEVSLLSRPVLSLTIGTVLAYIVARFIAEGKLSVNFLGVLVSRTINGVGNPVFQDSSALLLVGLLAGIASDILLKRLIVSARSAAEEAFPNSGNG